MMGTSSTIRNVFVGTLLLSSCSWAKRINYGKSIVKMDSKRDTARNQSEVVDSGNPQDHPYSGASIGSKIGGGSFGKVYPIRFPDAPNWAGALKHIDMSIARRRGVSDSDIAREFYMQHHVGKHVGLACDVLSWGVGSNRDAYAVVEYLAGGSLGEYVKEVWGGSGEGMGKQADELAKAIYAQIVFATMSMHRANVVHMDFKPDNIMINNYNCAAKYDPSEPRRVFRLDDWLDPQLEQFQQKLQKERHDSRSIQAKLVAEDARLRKYWQDTMKPFVATPADWEREQCAIKLIDFGLSCITSQQSTGCAHQSASMGTPVIMTKEQFEAARRGHKANQNMDIWAMGLVLYYMLFGTFPHLTNQGQLDRDAIMNDKFDNFQSAPWYWILYKSMNASWKQAAELLKHTMTSVQERYSAKQVWDQVPYIAEYKTAAMRADQREKGSERRELPASAGGVVEAEGNRKAAAMDSFWSLFKIDWGNLFSKFGS